MTSFNGQTITYDSIGNPLSYRGSTLSWNGRELTGITNSSNSITYSYDASGTRTSKIVNNQQTNYTYLDGKLIEEDGPNGKLCYTYDDGGNLVKISHTISSSTTDYYIITNSRGDVDSIYDTSGALIARYSYDSWGNTISITDSSGNSIISTSHIANINPIRYRGYYLDKETNFYHLGSRYYDPEVSRFISADDVGVVSLDSTSLYDKNLYLLAIIIRLVEVMMVAMHGKQHLILFLYVLV